MTQTLDPTFYRSPAEAIAAPPERLAYVAAYDRAGKAKDAMAVLDVDASSPSYGKVVGWSELPTGDGAVGARRPATGRRTAAGARSGR